eukprot:TRINITY_DN20622_c0_g1_i1.p1 TRINITY_DN20622_c0_g1~~TRINITY_DN20622_c0_g1_i1.p1  ORF type:complete len:899 (+),score=50.19 TRINITY_DN20622_c0_g1_i1:24-2699(+)
MLVNVAWLTALCFCLVFPCTAGDCDQVDEVSVLLSDLSAHAVVAIEDLLQEVQFAVGELFDQQSTSVSTLQSELWRLYSSGLYLHNNASQQMMGELVTLSFSTSSWVLGYHYENATRQTKLVTNLEAAGIPLQTAWNHTQDLAESPVDSSGQPVSPFSPSFANARDHSPFVLSTNAETSHSPTSTDDADVDSVPVYSLDSLPLAQFATVTQHGVVKFEIPVASMLWDSFSIFPNITSEVSSAVVIVIDKNGNLLFSNILESNPDVNSTLVAQGVVVDQATVQSVHSATDGGFIHQIVQALEWDFNVTDNFDPPTVTMLNITESNVTETSDTPTPSANIDRAQFLFGGVAYEVATLPLVDFEWRIAVAAQCECVHGVWTETQNRFTSRLICECAEEWIGPTCSTPRPGASPPADTSWPPYAWILLIAGVLFFLAVILLFYICWRTRWRLQSKPEVRPLLASKEDQQEFMKLGFTIVSSVSSVPVSEKFKSALQNSASTISWTGLNSEEENDIVLHDSLQKSVSHLSKIVTDSEGRKWEISSESLARGAFGSVYLGMGTDGKIVAVKVTEAGSIGWNSTDIQAHLTEVRRMATLRHDNVVQYVTSFVDGTMVYIVMEFVPAGSLGRLCEKYGKVPPNIVARCCRDILKGLQYLHKVGVVHRDIKPQNVLITNRGVCKLADFGASRSLATVTAVEGRSVAGTPAYISPEALNGTLSPASDIWSVGVLTYHLLFGKVPWGNFQNVMALMFHIASTDKPIALPEAIHPITADFIHKCLTRDHLVRPTATDLLEHPFLTQVANEPGASFMLDEGSSVPTTGTSQTITTNTNSNTLRTLNTQPNRSATLNGMRQSTSTPVERINPLAFPPPQTALEDDNPPAQHTTLASISDEEDRLR